jgi:hypothetical protein
VVLVQEIRESSLPGQEGGVASAGTARCFGERLADFCQPGKAVVFGSTRGGHVRIVTQQFIARVLTVT